MIPLPAFYASSYLVTFIFILRLFLFFPHAFLSFSSFSFHLFASLPITFLRLRVSPSLFLLSRIVRHFSNAGLFCTIISPSCNLPFNPVYLMSASFFACRSSVSISLSFCIISFFFLYTFSLFQHLYFFSPLPIPLLLP